MVMTETDPAITPMKEPTTIRQSAYEARIVISPQPDPDILAEDLSTGRGRHRPDDVMLGITLERREQQQRQDREAAKYPPSSPMIRRMGKWFLEIRGKS